MELRHSISNYIKAEFLGFVKRIYRAGGTTEEDGNKLVREFERLAEYPDGLDLIYYPRDNREDSPEEIVKEIKE